MANTYPVALSELAVIVERLPDAAQEERLRIAVSGAADDGSATVEAEGARAEARRAEFDRSGDGEAWVFKGEVLLDDEAEALAGEPGLAHAIRARLGGRCEEVEVESLAGRRAALRLRIAGPAGADDESGE